MRYICAFGSIRVPSSIASVAATHESDSKPTKEARTTLRFIESFTLSISAEPCT
jgi:hypothetical protein